MVNVVMLCRGGVYCWWLLGIALVGFLSSSSSSSSSSEVESSSLRLWFVVARTSSLVISLLVLALGAGRSQIGRDVVGMVVVVVVKRVWSLPVACRHHVAAVGIDYDVQGVVRVINWE